MAELSEVLDQLQLAFKSPINFEEAPLENPLDMVQVTVPGLPPRHAIPASDLTVVLTSIDSTAYLASQSVMDAYVKAGYPGSYSVVQRNNRIDILPASVKGVNGFSQAITPRLTMPLTFPSQKRTAADTIQLIADAASRQSGHPVLIINAPTLSTQTIEIGADAESFGDVIEDVASSLHTALSARLQYVIDEKACYLDFRGTAPLDPAGNPVIPQPPRARQCPDPRQALSL